MPRGKIKQTATAGNVRSKNTSNKEEDIKTIKTENIEIKIEAPESPEDAPSPNKIDLSQFKFERKPHVKIEYDKESPQKSEKEVNKHFNKKQNILYTHNNLFNYFHNMFVGSKRTMGAS